MNIENFQQCQQNAEKFFRAYVQVQADISGWHYDKNEPVLFEHSTDDYTDENLWHQECKEGFAALTGSLCYEDRDPIYLIARYDGDAPAMAFLLIRGATSRKHVIACMAPVN